MLGYTDVVHKYQRLMKASIYKKYISQLERTEKECYHFESAWLTYVLLEDRLLSILRNTGGENDSRGRQIRMMGPKIGKIKARLTSNSILRGHLEAKDLIPRLEEWKGNYKKQMIG
jgi:hypothetical protein